VNLHFEHVYLLLRALQVEHRIINSFPQEGQLNLTKFDLATTSTPQLVHLNILPLLDYLDIVIIIFIDLPQ